MPSGRGRPRAGGRARGGGPGQGRGKSVLSGLAVGALLATLGLATLEREAFAAPSAAQTPATKAKQQPHRAALTNFCGRNSRTVSQQLALPPQRIGACTPSGPRRGRRTFPGRRPTNLRASFTSLVRDIAMSPRVLLAEIAIVVLLSGAFETLEHKLRQRFARSGRETAAEILNVLFKEITVLGFVAFVIFLLAHTGAAEALAPMIFKCDSIYAGAHNTLHATFETVHMMIFMLLVVLLMQAGAMYMVSERIIHRWGGFERTASFGPGKATLETKFVEAGYLKRVEDPDSPRGTRLEQVKPFKYGGNWIERLLMRGRPLHKLLMWRAIRHEFLFPSEESVLDGKAVVRVPDPSLFNFEDYLRTRLGKVVLSLIHIDRWTWVVTLGVLAGPLYLAKLYPWIPNEAVHAIFAWAVALIGLGMTVALERDVFRLTSKIPQDVPKILKLFSGESFQMLRRSKLPGWTDRPLHFDKESAEMPLEAPEAITTKQKGKLSSTKGYTLLFRMLSFFQAVSITSLLLSHLSMPVMARAEWVWFLAACAEWPVFLFVIVPVIIRRLTIRTSILFEKDERLIRKVTTETKESLLRDYARLVQIMGYEERARESKEAWTLQDGSWDGKQAIKTVLLGLRKFDAMPPTEKREIWAIFAAWDASNDGTAEPREFQEAFASMGSARATDAIDNILRMVNFDGSGSLNWMKFKAIYGLATSEQDEEAMRADFKRSFEFLDTNKSGDLSIFELSKGFERMNIGMGLDDMANLLFLYFGVAKPNITMDEFVEWVVADRRATLNTLSFRA